MASVMCCNFWSALEWSGSGLVRCPLKQNYSNLTKTLSVCQPCCSLGLQGISSVGTELADGATI